MRPGSSHNCRPCRHCGSTLGLDRRDLCRDCYRDPVTRAMYARLDALAAAAKWTVCRHCRTGKVSRPRGLCWSCYYTDGVRDRYGIAESRVNRRGVGNGHFTPTDPATPCFHPVGSLERILTYERRAAAGERLWHPDDATAVCRPDEADGGEGVPDGQ